MPIAVLRKWRCVCSDSGNPKGGELMQLWVDMLFVNEKVLQLWPQLLALANTNTHLRGALLMTTFKATSAQWQNHRWKGVPVALSVFDGLAYEFHKKLCSKVTLIPGSFMAGCKEPYAYLLFLQNGLWNHGRSLEGFSESVVR
ncbi:hypothetical protein DY000_02022795 [Brassica cretica]|uniref:Uncharacterized protein n=1 Tax=Brassica cretica TaxID=69181 RepID=A0ABQ7E5W4_BRACR|nr:hypothetical protein DY000_02022795 [Brassica cretica]